MEQLKDKDKQLAGLRERVQGLQTDSSNTDTALTTLEEALSEKVTKQSEGWGGRGHRSVVGCMVRAMLLMERPKHVSQMLTIKTHKVKPLDHLLAWNGMEIFTH